MRDDYGARCPDEWCVWWTVAEEIRRRLEPISEPGLGVRAQLRVIERVKERTRELGAEHVASHRTEVYLAVLAQRQAELDTLGEAVRAGAGLIQLDDGTLLAVGRAADGVPAGQVTVRKPARRPGGG